MEARRRTPIQDRAHATVEAVLEATARVLVEVGYARLSTNRVAKRAGVSVGSLYQYFADKDALVEALARRVAERQLAVVLEQLVVDAEAPLEDAVRGLIRAVIASKRVDPDLSEAMVREVPRHGRLDVERTVLRRMAEAVAAALRRRSKQVRAVDPDLAAFALVHAVFSVIQGALEDRPELLLDDGLSDELTQICVRYLQPEEAVGG